MKARLIPIALLLAAAAMHSPLALAQSGESRDQEQVRRLRAQLQQVQRGLAEAQAGREAAERSLQETQAARQQAEQQAESEGAARRGLAGRLEQSAAEARRQEQALAETRKALATRDTELAAANAAGERLRRELAAEQGRLAGRSEELRQCVADNAALAGSARELLGLYADKGVGEVLSAGEPLLGLGQVRLENLLERYGDGIAAHDIGRKAGKPAAQ